MKEYKGNDFLPDNKKLELSPEIEKKFKEKEKKEKEINNAEHRRQTLETFFKSFFGEENFEEIKKLFLIKSIDKEFREIIEELFNDDEKLVKNKKEDITSKEKNRKIYSEFKKLDMYKDTSRLQEKIIYYLFPEMKSKLKVDYRSTIRYIEEGTNEQITGRADKKDIPEFLLNISKISEYFLEKYEFERMEVLKADIKSNFFKHRYLTLDEILGEDRGKILTKEELDKILNEERKDDTLKEEEINYVPNEEISEILNKIKQEIKGEKELKNKIYKWFLFFLQLYYNMNEEGAYLKILEQIQEVKREKITPQRTEVISTFNREEFLMCLDGLNRDAKDNLKEEKLASIYWYIYTVINDYKYLKQSNIQEISFYEGIYLNNLKYKKRKLSSYLDSHRKSEFILHIYDYLTGNREIPDYEEVIFSFFTNKEIYNYLSKSEISFWNNPLDSYSTNGEDDYVINIIKVIKNNKDNKSYINKELKRITSLYVKNKKKHGEFENNQTIHRDVKIIIEFVYKLYYFSYMDYEVYLILKKAILELIKLQKRHIDEIKKVITLL